MCIPNVGISLKKSKPTLMTREEAQCKSSLPTLFILFNSELPPVQKNGVFLQRLLLGIVSVLSFNTKFPGQAKRIQGMEGQESIMNGCFKAGKNIFQTHFEY